MVLMLQNINLILQEHGEAQGYLTIRLGTPALKIECLSFNSTRSKGQLVRHNTKPPNRILVVVLNCSILSVLS